MRKIQVVKWSVKNAEGKEVGESILDALSALLRDMNPDRMPRGLDNFRTFSKIDKAFKLADESNELILEEAEYAFLKSIVERNIPSVWAMDSRILGAVDAFLEAKPVEVK